MLENESMDPVSLELGFEFASDFADILSVKQHDFALGDPEHAKPLPAPAPCRFDAEHNQFVLEDPEDSLCTQIIFSRAGRVDGSSITFPVELQPRERWDVRIDVVPVSEGDVLVPKTIERRFGEERGRVRDSLAAWQLRVPQLRAEWVELERSFGQSVADLAALRMRSSKESSVVKLPAAGMPWFMTVFGRDTLITCLQTLLFGPELARNALAALAALQADEDDPSIDAEPGKIVHEVRHGKAAQNWFSRYYGTLDATPLYLILFSEVWRWTGDITIADEFKQPALKALEWIDRYGDRDGDGFVEFEKRSAHGLDVQSWKDSFDSQRFHDGRIAQAPIAPCEVQGYVYDAKRRMAEIARDAWRDRPLAERLDREADELKRRFDEAFWCEDRGGFYALALDGEKNRVDSICSNIGHLLWSQIVPPERVDADRRPADGRGPLVGVGRAHDVAGRRRVQPALVPQRNRLATRQFAHRVGARAVRTLARGASDRAAHARRVAPLRPPAARGLRRSAALGDAVSDRLSDGRAPAGVGGGDAGAAAPGAARPAAGQPPEPAGVGRADASCRTGPARSASQACARSSRRGM